MATISDAAREREVFKYYTPTATSPLDNAESPSSSSDAALNAFGQCSALRLKARLCLISLFSRTHQYIIAEATRTLSSQSDQVHDAHDQLWRGVGSIPRETGPCSQAFSFFCSPERPDHLILPNLSISNVHKDLWYVLGSPGMRFYAAVPIISAAGVVIGSFAIFDDVSRDSIHPTELIFLRDMAKTTMQHLEICRAHRNNYRAERMIKALGLFIEGKSSLRDWWLITGHKGQRSVDSKLRGGMSLNQMLDDEFGHQEAYGQVRSDRAASRNMISHGRPTAAKSSEDSASVTTAPSEAMDPATPSNATTADTETKSAKNILTLKEKLESVGTQDQSGDYSDAQSLQARRSRKSQSHSDGARLQDAVLSTDLRLLFSNASNLIRESMLVEGCLFLDASVGSFGGAVSASKKGNMEHKPPKAWRSSKQLFMVSSSEDEKNTSTGPDQEDMESDATPSAQSTFRVNDPLTTETLEPFPSIEGTLRPQQESTQPQKQSPEKGCGILGYSTSNRSSLNMHEASELHLNVREGFLQTLVKRYPHGRVFNFDENGEASTDEEEIRRKISGALHADKSKAAPDKEKHSRRRQEKIKERHKETLELAQILPGVRSVAFFPLWNSHTESWFAGCLVWSVEVSQLLDPEDDLVYLATFGNSIMAEVSRLNALVAAQMKLNFISSISHELRSPLHGILASTEFLQDTNMVSMQKDLVGTISACGKTLLDTIDHVLDFTKLSTDSKRRRSNSTSKKSKPSAKLASTSTQKRSKTTDISVLTEEVIESIYAGHKLHNYQRRPSTNRHIRSKSIDAQKTRVLVILDISNSQDWCLNVEPGAWRRILMNLFTNALKYTERGFIKITLQRIEGRNTDESSTSQVILGVQDSGKGISKSFLQHHLYIPFSQEDSLAVGTGLGLSIVRTLVEDTHGSIDFMSEQGTGTNVRISLPINSKTIPTTPLPEDSSVLAEVQSKTQGMRACLVGFNVLPEDATGILAPEAEGVFMLKSSISNLFADWFHMNIVHSEHLDLSMATISCIRESSLGKMSWSGRLESLDTKSVSSPGFPSRPILLVLCTLLSRERSFATQKGGYHVVYVQEPVGPHKLASVLARCFAIGENGTEVDYKETYFDQDCTCHKDKTNDAPIKVPRLEPPPRPGFKRTSSYHKDREEKSPPVNYVVSQKSIEVPLTPPYDHEKALSHKRHLVLLVEDNAINMNLLVMYMKKLGYDYEKAVNGQEAVNMFQHSLRAFDIIFMDISMPVMDGLQATREIRKLERSTGDKPVTIVALTGAASETSRQQAFSVGVDLFLTKPVPMKTLKKILEEIDEDVTKKT